MDSILTIIRNLLTFDAYNRGTENNSPIGNILLLFRDNNVELQEATMLKLFLRHSAFVIALTLASTPFSASANQTVAVRSEIQDDFQKAFWAMLADPANTEKTIRYAELAVKIGDYEAAIPPLERLLMLNPKLPKVRLEIGVLYYLLNSKEVARGYLNDVKNDPQAAPDLVKRAEDYLARL